MPAAAETSPHAPAPSVIFGEQRIWIAANIMEHRTELITLHRGFTQGPQILVALYDP